MCRHLAYAGPPVRLGELLVDPPHGLVRQAWAPRRQTHGTMNVDGFGVGWYVDGDPVPARHRGVGPVWGDETFAELCRVVRSRALLAAVRSATEGMVHGPAAGAPFRSGRWLFSHNGAVGGWPGAAGALAADLAPARLAALDAPTDAALLWALTLQRLDAGAPPAEALAEVVARAAAAGEGRLNLLLADGAGIWATTWGASLSHRTVDAGGTGARGRGVVVASEPYDDDPAWHDVPDGTVLAVQEGVLRLDPL